jgi:UDP-glucose 4-epimerase
VRVLVTGGAGFIGSHICDLLVEKGHEPVILDDLATGHVEQIHPKARFYQIDVGSPWLDELFRIEQPKAVIHQAAQASVRRSVEDPVFDGQVNVLGTVALLEASVKAGVKRFLFASTGGAIYGEADIIPTPEDYRPLPLSPYGASKLAAEAYLSTFNALHGLSTISLRYSNVYGPRQDPHGEAGVVAIFSGRLLGGEPAVINGDGKQTRDYVYVRDVAAANMRALESDAIGAFNVGTGTETDVNQIFAILRDLTGSNQEEKHGPPKPGEQRRSCVDPSKAGKVLGWTPKTGLREGLAETAEFFRAKASSESHPARRQAG